MEIYSHPDIPEILTIEGNSNCCDCNAEKPKWASLNNGVFLCLKCAGVHRSLGIEVSTIRSLQIDSWTDKQILYISKGGNARFKNNLLEYKIDLNSPTELKYKSKAADYYRKNLKNEIEKTSNKDYQPIEVVKPSLEEGSQLIEAKNGQSDVNNSKVIGTYNEQKKDEGFFGAFGSFINSVRQTAVETAGKLTKEIDDLKLGDKLKEAGGKVVDYAIISGNYIKDKGQQALSNEYVQAFTKTAESGINTVIEKTKVLLNNDANQKQNLNPNFLKNNEEQKNDNMQISNIINNEENNLNDNNNINNINNINDNNVVLNNGEVKNEEIPKKEDNIPNEEIPKKEDNIPNEEPKKEENAINGEQKKEENGNNEEQKKEENAVNEEKPKEENKAEEENKSKEENQNNNIDDKKVKEESVMQEPENQQNP
jgi:ADP-ribosylation factor GTPase-activating protein 1